MKKNLLILAVASAAIGLASCNGGFKQGPGGMLYNIHTDKDGPAIKDSDFIAINVVTKNDADSVYSSTYDAGQAVPLLVQKSQTKGDVFEALHMLSEGDSATIKVNVDSVFKAGQQRPPKLKGKYLVYDVKIEKVIPRGKLTEEVFQGRVSDYFKKEGEARKKREPQVIDQYASKNNIKGKKTASGIVYDIKPGSGPNVINGDTAVVKYTGKFVSGKVFDTSDKAVAEKEGLANPMRTYEPIKVVPGAGRTIKGWEDALLLFNKGAKGTIILPSALAYGEQGSQMMPPYTPLVFEMEVVDIIKPKAGAAPVAPAPAR
jgi:FKBP-type peptidyl-prolyl cis-trans isomerase FkpA